MKTVLIGLLLLFGTTTITNAQYYRGVSKKSFTTSKGSMFFSWGYNRSVYTESDLHIIGQGYDLTLKNAKAIDRPHPFSLENYFSIDRLTVPQFNIRAGYYFKNNWAISFGVDHMKYIFKDKNQVKLHGYVKPGIDTVTNLSGDYNGQDFTTDF